MIYSIFVKNNIDIVNFICYNMFINKLFGRDVEAL